MIDQETLGASLAYTNKALEALKNVVHYLGVTTTTLSDGATTNPITIGDKSVTAVNGDMVFYNGTAYTWDGTEWQETLSIAQIITQIETITEEIGNLSNLTTEEKSNLVGAINEVKDDMPTALSDLTDDVTHRTVSDTEKSAWNGKADTADVNVALAKKADITTVTIPAFTPSQAGWRRICKVTSNTVGSGLLYFGGSYSTGQPTSAIIAINIQYENPTLVLLSSGENNGVASKIRMVRNTGRFYWIDIYFPVYNYGHGPLTLKFTGDLVISDIQDPISITTNTTEASAELSLNTAISGRVLTDESTGLSDVTKLKYLNNVTSDIQIQINAKVEIWNNAGFHNSIYRGKFLGTEITAEQYAAIANGTFDDMYIGDYWIINGVIWRIAAFDYWLNTGDSECTTHHVVLVPDMNLDSQKMNDSNVTTGGYVGSKMYTSYITTARNTVISAFGSANILSHRQLFSNAADGNYASSWAWYDSTIDLMSESMVYGAPIGGKAKVDSINFNIGIDKVQLPLFALDPSRIAIRANWWLRDVVSSANFANVDYDGSAIRNNAGNYRGVRPAFGIKAQV